MTYNVFVGTLNLALYLSPVPKEKQKAGASAWKQLDIG